MKKIISKHKAIARNHKSDLKRLILIFKIQVGTKTKKIMEYEIVFYFLGLMFEQGFQLLIKTQ